MRMSWKRAALAGILALVAFAVVALLVVGCGCGDGRVTAARFEALRGNHTALRAFLSRMPKGADLHVHLSGAIYVEDFIAWGADKKLCYRAGDFTFITCQP